MTTAIQLPLALPHRPALSGEDFFVAPANEAAVAWIDRWPDWPGAGVVLHGDAGCGKSHLLQVFAARSGASVLQAGDLSPRLLEDYAKATVIAIDDADAAIARDHATEETLFHLFNAAKADGHKIMLAGKTSAARWPIRLPDLRSRLNTLEQVAIGAPDDSLLSVLLTKLFADRQLGVEPDTIAYLVNRMERSTAAAVRLVEAIDREALSRKRAITIPLVRSVLEREAEATQTKLNI